LETLKLFLIEEEYRTPKRNTKGAVWKRISGEKHEISPRGEGKKNPYKKRKKGAKVHELRGNEEGTRGR